MKSFRVLVASALLWTTALSGFAQGTAFTYQGRLLNGTEPANGSYDLQFAVFDAGTGGTAVGGPITNAAVAVSNGLFCVTLDFGATPFSGPPRWLEIGVRTNGGASFDLLDPRQSFTAEPYAITAGNLTGTLPATQLSGALSSSQLAGTYSGSVTLNNAANVFGGNGSGLTSVDAATLGGLASSNFWKLNGNGGTTAGADFVGTTDNQPLELKVNNGRALRLEPTTNGLPNLIGGASNNFIAADCFASTIVGGAGNSIRYLNEGGIFNDHNITTNSTIGGGYGNLIRRSDNSVIAGGISNSIVFGSDPGYGGERRGYNTISGGAFNTLGMGSEAGVGNTIAGGRFNHISHRTFWASLGGGASNYITMDSHSGTLGGGGNNYLDGRGATLSGGIGNRMAYRDDYATMSGGLSNLMGFSADFSTISGGVKNEIGNDVVNCTIAGGAYNKITAPTKYPVIGNSFIGGGFSNRITGEFGTIPGGANNIATNYAFAAGRQAQATNLGSFVWADSQNAPFASTTSNQVSFRAQGGVVFTSGSGGADETVAWTPGSGSWTFSSDRNLKDRFETLKVQDILEKVSRLSIKEWSYKEYPQRHIGVMAQDFHEQFPLNENDRMLNDADLHGVALAAIQGLNEKLKEKDREIETLKQKAAKVESRLNQLEQAIQSRKQ